MNYGPLEFVAWLRRHKPSESATVKAARAAAPVRDQVGTPQLNRMALLSTPRTLARVAREAQIEAVSVYEAVVMRTPGASAAPGEVMVQVGATARPVVLVLSSHQPVEWQVQLAEDARLEAVLICGYGESMVTGTGEALVSRIGGFYAFKRGSAEFRHLEDEVLRCTGRTIEHFQSVYAGDHFLIE